MGVLTSGPAATYVSAESTAASPSGTTSDSSALTFRAVLLGLSEIVVSDDGAGRPRGRVPPIVGDGERL
ncbi:hypothetical protein C5C45_00055 [Rathayibacter rathayi]|uniref:Uncharacterized protein n=1 Tax=Rathayibacter rathayi TaxID=33887 RepID=A0ABX5A845_RATRA|nr:hypothetical protein C5C34_14925 [Rathayibacter rathayi]PPF42459.1 hypothetical protein C5C08_14965 [Rathayibacter rathayi]PPF75108.1 hypothetical protein C5C14_14995 [Rathayibacter rathayi]PPG47089.1 hypothetical protein C5C20_02345 [Rathayibacter rathayi]PPG91160.1 hypothetical protein C5C22_14495 [Rathayibacter rathayi]